MSVITNIINGFANLRPLKADSLKNDDRLNLLETELSSLRLRVHALERLDAFAPEASTRTQSTEVADFNRTATLSHEGSIENTLNDASKIRVGQHSYVRGRLLTYGHGGDISIGEWCYVGVRTEIWSMNRISIGNRVLISHDVNIHDGTAHSQNKDQRHDHFRHIILKGHPAVEQDVPGLKSAPVIIEDDVWINFGVTILKGVTIGAGSIIAAKSIVTKDVPPGSIYKCEFSPSIAAITKI